MRNRGDGGVGPRRRRESFTWGTSTRPVRLRRSSRSRPVVTGDHRRRRRRRPQGGTQTGPHLCPSPEFPRVPGGRPRLLRPRRRRTGTRAAPGQHPGTGGDVGHRVGSRRRRRDSESVSTSTRGYLPGSLPKDLLHCGSTPTLRNYHDLLGSTPPPPGPTETTSLALDSQVSSRVVVTFPFTTDSFPVLVFLPRVRDSTWENNGALDRSTHW